MPYDWSSAVAHVTDVEYLSLDLRPGSDLYLLLGLVGFAGGLSLLFSLWPRCRQKSTIWLLAASSSLLASFSTIFLPILVVNKRLPGASLIHGSFERIAWIYVFGLLLAWIFAISILWTTAARFDRQNRTASD
jgi:hypothetical protein